MSLDRERGPSLPGLALGIGMGVLVLAAADTARMVATYRGNGIDLSWTDAVLSALMDWSLLGLLSFPAVYLAVRFDLSGDRRRRNAALHVIVAPLYGLAHVALFAAASVLWRGDAWEVALRSASLIKLPVSTGAYACIVLGAAAWAAHRREQREAERHARLTTRLHAARLEAVQARLQPHFLFNALNGIASLIETNPRLAEDLVARLGNLLRRAISTPDEAGQLVRLDDELDALEDFLEIERARLGDRLTVEIDVAESLRSLRLPPLLLQPLVENAILHGAARRTSGGRVRVVARRTEGPTVAMLEVAVEDNGPGFEDSARSGGYGLAATRERLELHFQEHAALQVHSQEDGGTRVLVAMPCLS